MGTQVVVPVEVALEDIMVKSKTYTQEELQAGFDLVKNAKDWKARIDRVIPKDKMDLVSQAVSHFTATQAYFVPHKTDANKVICRATGYRMGPAGP